MAPLSLAVVSTYPPTKCGLATFTASLLRAFRSAGAVSDVTVFSPSQSESATGWRSGVVHFRPDSPASVRATARLLGSFDSVLVQHEFGLYGANSGAAIIDLISGVPAPVVVTLHTVLSEPTWRQREITENLVEMAQATVVMSQSAHDILTSTFQVDPGRIFVIPHGTRLAVPVHRRQQGRNLFTWGLIGPGKGLEWSIEAVAALRDFRSRYVVAGETHPKVRAAQGEKYRRGLEELVIRHSLSDQIRFDNRYLNDPTLVRYLRGTDVVVLPYESTTQVTSGVLVEAVGAGIPVVATDFPHARELGAQGAVSVVPHQDPQALAAAIRRLLTDDEARARMSLSQRRLAGSFRWPSIAARYARLLDAKVEAVA